MKGDDVQNNAGCTAVTTTTDEEGKQFPLHSEL